MESSSKRDTVGGYTLSKRPNIGQISRPSGVSFVGSSPTKHNKEELSPVDNYYSPLKTLGASLVTSPSTKEILEYNLQQSKTPGSSTFSKGKITLNLQDNGSPDQDGLSALPKCKVSGNKSEKQNSKQQSKSIFYENDELSKHVNKYLNENLGPSENDWTSINTTENVDEEMSKVKMLEAWRFEMMKDKGMIKIFQYFTLYSFRNFGEQYRINSAIQE